MSLLAAKKFRINKKFTEKSVNDKVLHRVGAVLLQRLISAFVGSVILKLFENLTWINPLSTFDE